MVTTAFIISISTFNRQFITHYNIGLVVSRYIYLSIEAGVKTANQ